MLEKDDFLFYENLNIQKKYHGSNSKKLRKRLETNLKSYLKGDMINNISLIVLTYYTTFNVSDEEILIFKDELKDIKTIATSNSYVAMNTLCDAIPDIWRIMLNKHYEELISKE